MTLSLPFQYLLHEGVRKGATPFPGLLHLTIDPDLIVLSIMQGAIKYHFFQSLVWLDLRLNTDLPGHWRTLYPLVQWVGFIYIYILFFVFRSRETKKYSKINRSTKRFEFFFNLFISFWQTVSLYHNSPMWLDTRDASSCNRNLADFLSVTVKSASGYVCCEWYKQEAPGRIETQNTEKQNLLKKKILETKTPQTLKTTNLRLTQCFLLSYVTLSLK